MRKFTSLIMSMGLVAVLTATLTPQAGHAAGNCYAGTKTGRAQSFSYCETGSVWSNHHAKSKIYINSGYSTWALGPSKGRGAYSWTGDYTAQGYIMDGPYACTTIDGNSVCIQA